MRTFAKRLAAGLILLFISVSGIGCGAGAGVGALIGAAAGAAIGSSLDGGCGYDCGGDYYYATSEAEYVDTW